MHPVLAHGDAALRVEFKGCGMYIKDTLISLHSKLNELGPVIYNS